MSNNSELMKSNQAAGIVGSQCCQRSKSNAADGSTLNREASANNETRHQWVLPVFGMHCGACSARVTKSLEAVPGVDAVQVELDKVQATVVGDASIVTMDSLENAIRKAGYTTGTDGSPVSTKSKLSKRNKALPILLAIAAASAVVGFYLGLLTLTSDWFNAKAQFMDYRGWIFALAFGLGLQVGLFTYMRQVLAQRRVNKSAAGIAASGGMSTVAMALCCSHYLAGVLPAFGLPFLSGAVAGLAEYQTVFFLLGVASNIFGITYMLRLMLKNDIIQIQIHHPLQTMFFRKGAN